MDSRPPSPTLRAAGTAAGRVAAAAPAPEAANEAKGPAHPVGTQASASAPLPEPVRVRHGLDLTTVLGLAAGFALVFSALAFGGHARAFINVPSLMIVVGGTIAVTIVSFAREDLAACRRQLARALMRPVADIADVSGYVLQMAEAARRNGPLTLQPLMKDKGVEPLQARAIELVVDGIAAEDVERILRTEIEAQQARSRHGAAVLRRASEVAPAMGLIGTLVGLVQMLGNLQDPAAIGPAMAIALLTTFYGALVGNMALAPLAGKLERNTDAQAIVDTLFMLGAISIARQENPRRLEMMMNTVLPPELRLNHYD
ncbi:MotA/TolQ/ExbB proton channel family protein [Nitrospirillum amazonense]|uniref:motility protein A n=1 Tax=Nitrospirillum amazonense TaxID=28077 RepID=UPI002DD41D83|nr:MotA/TolQ/ExbB proton channel family protein [Nitrospirillum amazonense]MEC4591442.1 MotA/TolQ/ExbB proton channel family protein [Nitrospirillum amazonense]